jgi:hypothetical protein
MKTIDHGSYRVKSVTDDDNVTRLYLIARTGNADSDICDLIPGAALANFNGYENAIEIVREDSRRQSEA